MFSSRRNKAKSKKKREGIPISLWSYVWGGDEAVRQMRIGLNLPPDIPPKKAQPKTCAGTTAANTTTNTKAKADKAKVSSPITMGSAASRSQKSQRKHNHSSSGPTACKTCGHGSAFPAPAPPPAKKSPPPVKASPPPAKVSLTLGASTFTALGTAKPTSTPDAGLSEQDKKLIEVKNASPGMKWPDVAAAMGLGPKDIQGLTKRYKELKSSGAVAAAAAAGDGGGDAAPANDPLPTTFNSNSYGGPAGWGKPKAREDKVASPQPEPENAFGDGAYGNPFGPEAYGAPKARGNTAAQQSEPENAFGGGTYGKSFSAGAYGAPKVRGKTAAQQPEEQQNQPTQKVEASGRRVKILDGAGIFTLDELELIWKIIMKDEQNRWLRVSSKLFDDSGVNVHPDDIKEAFGEEE